MLNKLNFCSTHPAMLWDISITDQIEMQHPENQIAAIVALLADLDLKYSKVLICYYVNLVPLPCHGICKADGALTWVTMKCSGESADTQTTGAFESKRITLSLWTMNMSFFLQQIFSIVVALAFPFYSSRPWCSSNSAPPPSFCLLLRCEAWAASPRGPLHLNYISAIMQSAQL